MQYCYKVAWTVVGGINLPQGAEPIELYRSGSYRFMLTNNPDSLLLDVDRGVALGRLLLFGLVGQNGPEEFSIALEKHIEEIKAERTNKFGSQPVLVFEANGEIEPALTSNLREHENYVVTLDAFDKKAVMRNHQAEIESMKLAIAFESEYSSKFAALSEDTFLISETGQIIYSINLLFSGEVSASSALLPERAVSISDRFSLLQNSNDLKSVGRLIAQMTDSRTDRLKAFLAGWTALEILISKAFMRYEDIFLSPLTNAEQPSLRERFLERVKGVMKDKYRLTDKFVAVAVVMFPNAPDEEIQDDFREFCNLKKMRDSILHGVEFLESALPNSELASLLRKYVLAHVKT